MLASRIKNLREYKDISQRELSNIIGVSQQTVGSWEVDRTSPDPDMLLKLANFFNVTTDYLLGNSDNPTPSTAVPISNIFHISKTDPEKGIQKYPPEMVKEIEQFIDFMKVKYNIKD